MKRLRGIISVLLVLLILNVNIPDVQATGLSSNANLSSFKVQQVLSTGETKDVIYSPVFSPDVTTYTATLEPTCTKLVITAVTEDASATTTTNWTSMDPGDNQSWVAVKAANGTTKSYYINSRVPLQSETTTEPETTTVEAEPVNNDTDSDDEGDQTYTEIVAFTDSGSTYTLVNAADTSKVPAGYEETKIKVKKKNVKAWTKGNGSAFYLVYAVDSNGALDLYSYDNEEGTIQRFNNVDYGGSQAAEAANLAELQKDYDELKDTNNRQNSLKLKIIILLAAILLILIFIVLNLIIKIKDFTSIDDDQYKMNKALKKQNKQNEKSKKSNKKYQEDEDEYEYSTPTNDMLINDEINLGESNSEVNQTLVKKSSEESSIFSDDDGFDNLDIDLTDSILAELTQASQELDGNEEAIGIDLGSIVSRSRKDDKDEIEMPIFNTNNLPNPNRFRFDDLQSDSDEDSDFEFFDFDDK